MAPCGQNYVTPTMIKRGRMTIGDRIQMEEESLVNGPAPEEIQSAAEEAAAEVSSAAFAETSAPQPQSPGNDMNRDQGSGWGRGNTAAEQQYWAASPSPGSADFSRPSSGQSTSPSGTPTGRPVDIASIPLIFEEMTNYTNTISESAGNTPIYGVPGHPMVPPEYQQTVDYDSVQYMNGFLRTQIGRGVLVQQLIGSGNTVDRYGFLVGMGNNYLLLQDFSDGNIMVIDFYTVKYVYIYYTQPSFLPPIMPR
ncbi:MAG: hypothetical protein IKW01_05275 [Firmicutes bacterium]|nr:hypothetical protein [Bacillota bacterium]